MPQPLSDTTGEIFLAYAASRLELSAGQIVSALAHLDETRMQTRGADHENSIVNLLLHLEGNLRQWILHGVAGQPDVRRRDDEFDLQPRVMGAQALAALQATLAEAAGVIRMLSPERLPAIVDPQPTGTYRNPTTLAAIFKAVGHVEHHAGQIVLLTKQLAGVDLDLSMPRPRAAAAS